MAAFGKAPWVDREGRTHIRLADVDYVLRAPTVKEYRELRRRIARLQDEVDARTGEGGDLDTWEASDEVCISWWVETFTALEETGRAFPFATPDLLPDDAPLWLVTGTAIGGTVRDMAQNPAGPGGN